jgi:precorrin-6B C5,15-methyltransferase / cobalt-precorrin-6B C5,C15-methyltransferase
MLAEEATAQTVAARGWLSIVGVGENGVGGLSQEAQELIRSAQRVFGAERHLELLASLIGGRGYPWRRPFDPTFAEVLAHRGTPVCVLASGDPMYYGAGANLSRLLAASEARVIPALSAFSLAAARLHWPLAEAVPLSLCGRSVFTIRPHLQPGARLLLLSATQHTPGQVAELLVSSGFGPSQLTILEALGGPRERVRTVTAAALALSDIQPLNMLALEVIADPSARIIPRSCGLPDDYFEHDGQLTKQDVRALALSALAPQREQLLWDVGAGAGSIAIEWMLSDPTLRAIAVERSPERAARIVRNAQALGVPDLKVIEGRAPEALEGLARPDAVFLGGGLTVSGLIEAAQSALPPGGRLVANAVSLQAECRLLQCHKSFGGSLTRIALSRARPLGEAGDGEVMGWRAALPITQWRWIKG